MTLQRSVLHFDSLPDTALLSAKEICVLANRSLATIWREVGRERLPKPIKLSPNAARWRVADVRSYLGGCHDQH